MENILLMDENDPLSLKIIDFGIAGIWSVCGGGDKSTAGTLYYTPPEIISETDVESDPKIDIWALGVILYIMLIKRYPFKGNSGNNETRQQILKSKITFESRAEKKLSKEVKHLISKLLEKNKADRYSMRDICSHPWLDDVIDRNKEINPLSSMKNNLVRDAMVDEIKNTKYPELIGKNSTFYYIILEK